MSLENFLLWSPLALKNFLVLRKKSVDGTFQELASRAFVTWEENLEVDLTKEQQWRANLAEYKEKLKICGSIIPDPCTITDGWVPETGFVTWPSVYFCDISEYLRMHSDLALYNRLCSEYKQGKAYRYFTSGWVQEVRYHPISKNSPICILSTRVSPSMRTSMPAHQVWVAVAKDSNTSPGGTIYSAYCTCTAGLHGTCNHIAALLFRVEYAVRTGLVNVPSTSRPCIWDQPTMSSLKPSNPVKLCGQKLKKCRYLQEDDNDYQESVQGRATVFSPWSETQEQYCTGDTVKIQSELDQLLKTI